METERNDDWEEFVAKAEAGDGNQLEEELEQALEEAVPDEAAEGVEVPTDEQQEAASDEEAAERDWKAKYEEALQKVRDLEHRYQSDRGRFLAAQKVLAERGVSNETIQEALKSPESWEQFKEEAPDVAQAIDAYVEAKLTPALQKVQRLEAELSTRLEPIYQEFTQQQLDQQVKLLEERHPDWKDIAASQEFAEWLQTQPPGVQHLAQSDYADEVSVVLTAFKTSTGKGVRQPSPATESVKQSRDERIQRAATMPRSTSAAMTADAEAPDDEEAAWKFFVREKLKEQRSIY